MADGHLNMPHALPPARGHPSCTELRVLDTEQSCVLNVGNKLEEQVNASQRIGFYFITSGEVV